MSTEDLHFKDLPPETLESVCDSVGNFTVGLFRISKEREGERLTSIGAGTLVTISGRPGVLTAEHVVAALRDDEPLGLIADFTGKVSRYRFEPQHFNLHRIARGTVDSRGPDIGFVELAEADIGMLRAQKTFYNVDSRIPRFAEGYLYEGLGFWFSCGLVGEFERPLPPQPGYSSIVGCHGLCGASVRPRLYAEGEYDYLEIDVHGISKSPELPTSFGGMSGGGVWQVLLKRIANGTICAQEAVLSGVIFYQTALAHDGRTLRCHGRDTVYRRVPEYLRNSRD